MMKMQILPVPAPAPDTSMEQEQLTIMCCLSSIGDSSDSHFRQIGETFDELDFGCYHHVQKPACE